MTLAARVELAIRGAGVPIEGVALGDEANKSTWLVLPSELQAAAQPTINAFVFPTTQDLTDEHALQETTRKELRAVAEALWEAIPAPTMTKLQMRNRAIAIYKTLP